MVAIRTTWLALLVVCCNSPTSSFEIYGVDVGRALRTLSKNGLGQQKIQEMFDKRATFSTSLPNGKQTVQTLASLLGDRLNDYNNAVRNFQRVLVAHYDKINASTDNPGTQLCCKVDDSRLPFLEKFNSKVDILTACLRRTANSEMDAILIPKEIIETLRINDNRNDNMAWQYFGSETGLTMVYPRGHASNCGIYDPRLRPWYGEASATTPKDIVIIFENTVSKWTRDIKQAVSILVNTTNPNDRLTVVAVNQRVETYVGSEEYSPCYSQDLALATPLNRNTFLQFIKARRPEGRSIVKYMLAVNKAFEYLQRSDRTIVRSKLLVFMVSSDPFDVLTPEEIVKEIAHRNSYKVVIQTYAFGNAMSTNTRNILKAMAENTTFRTPSGISKKGTCTVIDPETDLRSQLHSYYNIFTGSTSIKRPLVTVPYVDSWGLGLVVSLCLPVHTRGALRGVACVDAKLEDIFFNITYYPENKHTYVFVIDGHGRAVLHPSLPKPIAILDNPVFIDIATLERDQEAAEILISMKNGKNGSKTFYSRQAKEKLRVQATVLSHYYWMKVPHTNYSLCIVFMDCYGTVEIEAVRNSDFVKYMHPNSLISATHRSSTCKHRGTMATTDGSVVQFSGTAYRWLTSPVNAQDKTQRMRYENFFKLRAHDQGEAFKTSTQLWMSLSGLIEDIWKATPSARYNFVILWRHLATASGIIRIYPGTLYSNYDPSTLPWYKLATLNPGSLIISSINPENGSLMISHAIYKGSLLSNATTVGASTTWSERQFHGPRSTLTYLSKDIEKISDGQHSNNEIAVAVVAGEIKSSFLYNLLEDLYPACKQARCFIVDQGANILAHKLYGRGRHVSHLTAMEPVIARYLRKTGQMKPTSCMDFTVYRTLSSWMLMLRDFAVTSESPRFELHTVPGTNVFVGIAWPRTNNTHACECQKVMKCRRGKGDQCRCPCYEALRFNFCNNTLPTRELNLVPTCPLMTSKFDIIQPPPGNFKVAMLTDCFRTSCRQAHSSSECLELDACTWCRTEDADRPMCHVTRADLLCRGAVPARVAPPAAACVTTVLAYSLVVVLVVIAGSVLYRCRRSSLCVDGACARACDWNKAIAKYLSPEGSVSTSDSMYPIPDLDGQGAPPQPVAPRLQGTLRSLDGTPPPQSRIKRKAMQTQAHAQVHTQTIPTQAFMEGEGLVNDGYATNDKLYELVEDGCEPHKKVRLGDSGDEWRTSRQKIIPHWTQGVKKPNNFPAYSTAISRDLNGMFHTSHEDEDDDEDEELEEEEEKEDDSDEEEGLDDDDDSSDNAMKGAHEDNKAVMFNTLATYGRHPNPSPARGASRTLSHTQPREPSPIPLEAELSISPSKRLRRKRPVPISPTPSERGNFVKPTLFPLNPKCRASYHRVIGSSECSPPTPGVRPPPRNISRKHPSCISEPMTLQTGRTQPPMHNFRSQRDIESSRIFLKHKNLNMSSLNEPCSDSNVNMNFALNRNPNRPRTSEVVNRPDECAHDHTWENTSAY